MSGRFRAIPRADRPAPKTGARLAGSRSFWFDALRDDGGQLHDIGAVSPEVIARISAPRPDLCGLSLDRPRVMGILNVTPDSFSDGGVHNGLEAAVAGAQAMAKDADILDIGGESTRPGAPEVPVDEEIQRTAPVIRAIRAAGLTIPISIDTRKAAVAEAALDAGADIVNDVSALVFDPNLAALVAERGVPLCLMHMRGLPQTMQGMTGYNHVLLDVFDGLEKRISAAIQAGITSKQLIVDPGIGFGKTPKQCVTLLQGLALYHTLGVPLLFGASRKRFIGEISGAEAAKDRVAGSVAVALHAAAQGAHILRVHDTYETRQALDLFMAINEDELA